MDHIALRNLRKTILMAIAATSLLLGTTSLQAQPGSRANLIEPQLAALESRSGGRLGVALINTADNSRIVYRGDERFALCSTSKVMAVAALLKQRPDLLNQLVPIRQSDLVNYNPVTAKQVGHAMTLAQLSAAALQYSDNAAMNKILEQLGGPANVTAFARSIGDTSFRLDRNEPSLNTAIPGDARDTTTPLAMAQSLQRLGLGNALAEPQRTQLQLWMKGNTTGAASIRAGLPPDWIVGDKTGSGDYGSTNDIAIIWPPNHAPLILAIYFTQAQQDAQSRRDVLAAAARIVTAGF
jgi:beta-lactamase class A